MITMISSISNLKIISIPELNVIVEALKKWNLDPALQWALAHEEQLNKRNSVLIFKLYKLKFIEMLKKIDQEIQEYKADQAAGLVVNNNGDRTAGRLANGNGHKNGHLKVEEDAAMTDDGLLVELSDSPDEHSAASRQYDHQPPLDGLAVGEQHLISESDDYISRLEKELISFARTNLQPYFIKYHKEIQQLMCCLLYLPSGIRKCPYRNLFNIPESEVVDLFTREACSLLGLSVESPLIVTFNAGCKALPALINIRWVFCLFCLDLLSVFLMLFSLSPQASDASTKGHKCVELQRRTTDRNRSR